MAQQDQTQAYFGSIAEQWQHTAANKSVYSVIEGRHLAVHHVMAKLTKGALLDVGCGTGQLCIKAAKLGWRAEGIDFSPAMIEQCRANAASAGSQATFRLGSIFDEALAPERYDAISAMGFIEYVSSAQCDDFFRCSAESLRKDGALIVGSRNRIFNAYSANDFTMIELGLGTLQTLMLEACALQAVTPSNVFEVLRPFERIERQPEKHPFTGTAVDTRYQYSPAELSCRLKRAGLSPFALYPVHFHGLPRALAAENPSLHSEMASLAAARWIDDPRLIPFCSTFVIAARRT